MATKLEKPIVRESTDSVDNRNIMVCFQSDQTIRLKLKGLKSGVLSIGIKELYDYLINKDSADVIPSTPKTNQPIKEGSIESSQEPKVYDEDEPVVNLNDFRSAYMVEVIPYEIRSKLESITTRLLEPYKKRKKRRNDS